MAPNSTELGMEEEEKEKREAAMRSKTARREGVALSEAPQATSLSSH